MQRHLGDKVSTFCYHYLVRIIHDEQNHMKAETAEAITQEQQDYTAKNTIYE